MYQINVPHHQQQMLFLFSFLYLPRAENTCTFDSLAVCPSVCCLCCLFTFCLNLKLKKIFCISLKLFAATTVTYAYVCMYVCMYTAYIYSSKRYLTQIFSWFLFSVCPVLGRWHVMWDENDLFFNCKNFFLMCLKCIMKIIIYIYILMSISGMEKLMHRTVFNTIWYPSIRYPYYLIPKRSAFTT